MNNNKESYVPRVELRDAIGKLVKFVSGREAAELVRLKSATISDRGKKRVLSIALMTPPAPTGRPTPFSLAMYTGQSYTVGNPEKGQTVDFNHSKIRDLELVYA